MRPIGKGMAPNVGRGLPGFNCPRGNRNDGQRSVVGVAGFPGVADKLCSAAEVSCVTKGRPMAQYEESLCFPGSFVPWWAWA